MYNDLTEQDIRKMQEEIDYRRLEVMPGLIEEVKRTRAFGDLSENYEYKTAKQALNKNKGRIRYLENMIKTANIIKDCSTEDRVGLYDRVTIFLPEDGEEQVIQVVTTVRTDPFQGFISKDSPLGRAVLGRRAGETVTVRVNASLSYPCEIRSIEKGSDDGSAPLMSY